MGLDDERSGPSSIEKSVMSADRQKQVREVFGRLDKDGKEYCREEDIRGIMNPDEVQQFFTDFVMEGEEITYLEFADYYSNISNSMDDEEFADKIKRDWP